MMYSSSSPPPPSDTHRDTFVRAAKWKEVDQMKRVERATGFKIDHQTAARPPADQAKCHQCHQSWSPPKTSRGWSPQSRKSQFLSAQGLQSTAKWIKDATLFQEQSCQWSLCHQDWWSPNTNNQTIKP